MNQDRPALLPVTIPVDLRTLPQRPHLLAAISSPTNIADQDNLAVLPVTMPF
jgi:hypothetical protein